SRVRVSQGRSTSVPRQRCLTRQHGREEHLPPTHLLAIRTESGRGISSHQSLRIAYPCFQKQRARAQRVTQIGAGARVPIAAKRLADKIETLGVSASSERLCVPDARRLRHKLRVRFSPASCEHRAKRQRAERVL